MTTIALVDDEQSILTSVSLALEAEGYNVDTYKNGVEALQGLESKEYDLGLFDIKMPKKRHEDKILRSCKRSYRKRAPAYPGQRI